MKYISFIIGLGLLALTPLFSAGQVLTFAEQMPEYPGGADSLLKEIASRVEYPKQCADSNIGGKVFVKFIVNEDGAISDVQVVKSPHPLLSVAAINAVKTIGKFKPGMQSGKTVKVWNSVPVIFKIKSVAPPVIDNIVHPGDPHSFTIFDYYPGGYASFEKTINKNLHYPEAAKQAAMEARITVVCKISDSLTLVPVSIKNGLDSSFNEEALRLIDLLPALNDKARQDNLIRRTTLITIYFALNPNNNLLGSFSERNTNTRYYDKGVKSFNDGKYKEASEYFTSAINEYSLDGAAFFNRGVAKIKMGDAAGACQDFRRACLLGESDAQDAYTKTCK